MTKNIKLLRVAFTGNTEFWLKESLKPPRSLVVDSTLVPTWSWRSQGKTNFSGKHKRACFNHQVICTLDGRLLAITEPPPGARYDAHAFRAHGLDRLLDSSTLADKDYEGLGRDLWDDGESVIKKVPYQ